MDEFIISVFYEIDNFCKELKEYFKHFLISHKEEAVSFEPPSAVLSAGLTQKGYKVLIIDSDP